MNKPTTQLKDLIHVEKGIIPPELCDACVNDIKRRTGWQPHEWYSNDSGQITLDTKDKKELDILFAGKELDNKFLPIIFEVGSIYNEKFAWDSPLTSQIISTTTILRFNRYREGEEMFQHMDHIHSLFEGERRGIPVLSFILNFNDDYEGADLYFWDDTVVSLGKGDIIVWPSLFLFPHAVSKCTKGTRYSAVTWAW